MSSEWKLFFNGKHATQLGLGVLGRGVQDAQFLAEHVAHLTVTDVKTADQLSDSIAALAQVPSSKLTLVLGEHRLNDFEGVDFVLKGAGVPLSSPYIAHAQERGIPIYMDEALFSMLAPPTVQLIGITGTRGKTTTTLLLNHILNAAVRARAYTGKVHLAGNIRGVATLPLLDSIQADDTVVAELSSWQLQGFGDIQKSPRVAVFTNFFADHLNYYNGSMEAYFADKAHVFAHQTSDDVLIMSPQAHRAMQQYWHGVHRGRIQVVDASVHSSLCSALMLPGAHNVQNASLAIAAAKALGIDDHVIEGVLRTFRGAPGRLERLAVKTPVRIYNDATSTTPDALRVALETLAPLAAARGGKLVLICGGTSKELVLDGLVPLFVTHQPTVITIPGTGTDALRSVLDERVPITSCTSLPEAVTCAQKMLTNDDVLVFSPGFASFGEFINEFDRNDTFVRLVHEQFNT